MDLSKPIIACDSSYFVFYRYYAIKGWYKRAHEKDVDVHNVLENLDFMKKYDSTFEKTINDLAKKFKVPHSNIIFAKDCSRDKIWRSSLYSGYKSNRDDKTASFNCDIFKHTYNTLLPSLQSKYRILDLYHNNLEADDIIALLVRKVRQISSTTRIVVITNDNDYVQLYKHNIDIFNLQNKPLSDRIENVHDYLIYKIIVGDKSDNIKSIGRKIGDKTAKKMIQDRDQFEKVMTSPEVKESFELNRTLIDFECIPEVYVKEMTELINKILV